MVISLKQILVPTDFSEPSEVAVRYAKALAEAFQASLHVLHVIEDPYLYGWSAEGYIPSLPTLRDEMEKTARDMLGKTLSEADRQQFHAQVVVRNGTAFVEIVRYAKEADVDLIVLGTHGRAAIAHMLMGSVAEKVVRKAPCPVLTVRRPEHEFVMP
jgi:nucleotide-binding universal stress UspA family protein